MTGSRKKLGLALTAVVAGTAMALSACSSNASSADSPSAAGSSGPASAASAASPTSGGDLSIAWVVGNTQDAFYQKATEGALAEAKDLGITLINQGPDAFDPAKQIPVLDTLLAQEPDALAIAPTDPEALRAPLKRWSDAQIPIVVFDAALTADPGFDVVSQIGSDNTGGGEMAADEMSRLLGGTGEVAIIDLNTSNTILNARAQGFKDKLAKDHPGVTVVDEQYTELDFPRAQTIAQTMVSKHPNLKGIFATYSFATEYAAKGLADLGKSNDVNLVGFEAGEKQIAGLEDGSIKAVVAQQPFEEGRAAVRAAYDRLTGKGDPEASVQLENVLLTADNYADMTEYYYQVK